MNGHLTWAQEYIDMAKGLLAEGGDDLEEHQICEIHSCLWWANYYIEAFYKEQQK